MEKLVKCEKCKYAVVEIADKANITVTCTVSGKTHKYGQRVRCPKTLDGTN